MANRETENYRSSITQVAAQEPVQQDSGIIGIAADIGQQIIRVNQEAKITENFSKAQVELQRLNTQYQIDYESNPMGGLKELKKARDDVFNNLGNEISPFFKRNWQDNIRGLSMKDDLATEAWAMAQTRKNTVKSINETIKADLSRAAVEGENFGNSDSDEIETMLNYAASKSKLMEFGDRNLGAETTTQLLETYDDDYLKTFISGVSQSNPLKALRLMDDEAVKKSFIDQRQYMDMRDAIENRALNVQEIMGDKQVLNILRDENNLLTRSMEGNVSYADLQSAFSAQPGMSEAAKSYFMKANGYTGNGSSAKLSPSEKMSAKVQLHSAITELVSSENLTAQDIAEAQTVIFSSLDKGVLNTEEAGLYLGQIVSPLATQKEEQLKTFSVNSIIHPDMGFKGLEKIYTDHIEMKPNKGEKDVGPLTKAANDANKVKLYDYYMISLVENARSYGVDVANIKQLDKTQQRKLYAQAQNDAIKLYQIDTNPILSTLNDLPNQTIRSGKLIQGAAGDRNLKPDISVMPTIEMNIGSDGFLYRRYPDGRLERAGIAPEGAK